MKPKNSPPSKGQGTLFSFFSKKETPPTSREDARDTKPKQESGNRTPLRDARTSPKQLTQDSEELVGKRLKVFWRDDNNWYYGRVVSFSGEDGKHLVHYDDGDKEKLVLAEEKFELAPEKPAQAAKKNRARVIKDDDDEAEWNKDQLEDSMVDDRSSYQSENNDDSEEMSEEYAESDDSAPPVTPKRKPSPRRPSKRAGQTASSPTFGALGGSGVKRPKKASDQPSYAITETKSPGSVTRACIGSPPANGRASPVGTPARSTSGYPVLSGMASPESAEAHTPRTGIVLPEGVLETGRHTHHSLGWLYKERADKSRRRPSDPEYNSRTLYVPPSFIKSETPAMQQWWLFKSENMDTVLFFKVGKFYELFHQDADVGMQELDLIYMKGEKAHSGFPEISYGKFADSLVSKGFRVARVEQVETPDMLKARNASKGKYEPKEKVVKRELCSILSRGTRTYCFLDDVSSTPDGSPRSMNLILSIKESALDAPITSGVESKSTDDGPPPAACEFGICMVDATTATFSLGQFADDSARSRLRTLLAQQLPVEVVVEKDNLSETTAHMIKCMAPLASHITLRKSDEFWDASRTLQELADGRYFDPASGSGQGANGGSVAENKRFTHWPPILRAIVEGGKDGAMALSALGGATWHTRRALIDHDLLSMRRFGAYIPPDLKQAVQHAQGASCGTPGSTNDTQEDDGLPDSSALPGSSIESPAQSQSHMILDGVTLSNLEIIRNTYDGGEKGSLWAFVNRCSTAFGRRLLKDWVMKPLLHLRHINARLDAVSELVESLSPEADATRALLKKLPDIERLLSRVHSMASKHRSSEHPESRAIMYEDTKYSIRKVNDFLTVLDGLEAADGFSEVFSGAAVQSTLLRKCVLPESEDGQFPLMTSAISFFRKAFDAAPAKKNGVIRPKPGVDTVFDEAKERIKKIESHLQGYLQEQRKRLGCSDVTYWGSAKDKYQLEVPEKHLSRNGQPADYELKSKKKGWMRFWTPFIKEHLQLLADAEQQLGDAQKDQMRRLFAKFDEHRELWAKAVRCLAHLDALLSLADVSAQPGHCRPQFYDGKKTASFIRLQNARHPCLAQTYQGGEYIPNNATLGPAPPGITGGAQDAPKMLLLTGPNMGGKSTLLRQTCLVAVLSQIGCFVPADEAHLTPFDRIFTRVGASDRILAGQSTFFVELSETANILHHATSSSLVILDELGRGTSTFDGTAIAHAVAHFLVKSAKCLAMFATHYHSLVEEWGQRREVALGHMSCLVEENGGEQRVTFLYKLAPGPCPKSFGINVARLAQLPDAVISAAQSKSEEFERALLHQHTAMAGDDKGRLALGLLASLACEEDGTEVVKAGEQLRCLWVEAQD